MPQFYGEATLRSSEARKRKESLEKLFGVSKHALWAFGVHVLTASGAFFAFLSLVAAAEKNFVSSFLWLGIAFAVDGADGPLARKLHVRKWWPHWSGEQLDMIIDYVTYVTIPAFILYQSGLMGKYFSFAAAAVIVTTGAIYYADTRMKTEDYGFRGFPICWNITVFTLFITSPSELLSFGIVLVMAALTFAPIMFIHPVRVKILRKTTLSMLALWSLAGIAALIYRLDPPAWIDAIIVISSLYLLCIGFILQALGKLR